MGVIWGTSPATVIQWGDLLVHGGRLPGAKFTFRTLEGWEGWDGRTGFEARPSGHGSFDAPVWAADRVVTVTGRCISPDDRDALFLEFSRAMTPHAPLQPLTVTHAGVTTEVGARLTRFKPVGTVWGAGVFDWAAEWVAPDPLRYGPEVVVESGLPAPSGGLRFDLFGNPAGVLDFGPVPEDGLITLVNEGTADTHPVFEVRGPLPDFSLTESTTGSRVEFVGNIPATSTLTLDPASGVATLDGTADRSGRLTRREWVPVPAGGVSRWLFASSRYDAAAKLTATVKAAYW